MEGNLSGPGFHRNRRSLQLDYSSYFGFPPSSFGSRDLNFRRHSVKTTAKDNDQEPM